MFQNGEFAAYAVSLGAMGICALVILTIVRVVNRIGQIGEERQPPIAPSGEQNLAAAAEKSAHEHVLA